MARPDHERSTFDHLQSSTARKEVNLLLNVIQALSAQIASRIKREEGQTIVEYALVLGGVSLVLIVALVEAGLGDEFTTLVSNIADQMGTGDGG